MKTESRGFQYQRSREIGEIKFKDTNLQLAEKLVLGHSLVNINNNIVL